MPGNDLLSHGNSHTTIGDVPFHFRVRYGIGWYQYSIVTRQTFAIDIETCPHCGGKLRVIACIEDPPLIAQILGQVQQREALNNPLARAPPGHQEPGFNLI